MHATLDQPKSRGRLRGDSSIEVLAYPVTRDVRTNTGPGGLRSQVFELDCLLENGAIVATCGATHLRMRRTAVHARDAHTLEDDR
jgi:hypothetical protein